MEEGFLNCDNGNKSSKRLGGLCSGAAGIVLGLFGGICSIFAAIAKPKVLLICIALLFIASFIYFGLTSLEKIVGIIKSLKK